MASIDDYPPGFPVPAEEYTDYTFEDYEIDVRLPEYTAQDVRRDDVRTRELKSLYPYEFLDPATPRPALQNIQIPNGSLRKEMVQKIQKDGDDGDWRLVEFVPPWTDPDWNDRFVYTGPIQSDNPHVYMKPGLLQKQRPALLPDDIAVRGPTEVAKRFGTDPIHQDDPYYSHSGVTPTAANFEVPLGFARVTPSNQGDKDKVDVDDFNALFTQFEAGARAQGENNTEENLRAHLKSAAKGVPTSLVQVDPEIANALLTLMDQLFKLEEQEEYQRLLFARNTSNDLVRNNVWTIGMDAVTDLSTPLHELVTQDKWEITDLRSSSHQETGQPVWPRTVYNLSGRQGEYCMSNDLVRAALQPTLQLVSKILYSDHPATWAWADIYRLRPIRDGRGPTDEQRTEYITHEHRKRGITEQESFALWLGDYDRRNWYPEVESLNRAGFDSVKYACEVLKRTIQWEINPKYGIDHDGKSEMEEHMAYTRIVPHPDRPEFPFAIEISLSADYIWPLLVEDYSAAEKAVCSFNLAVTMLHELSHALSIARQQLLHPSRSWVGISSQWRDDITDDILENLITFGHRFLLPPDSTWTDHIYSWMHDVFFQNELDNEEGWATENQYFGGRTMTLTSSSGGTRFLDEMTIMGCLAVWPYYSGIKIMPSTYQPIPRDMILKLFSEHFWTHEMAKWGHQALKFWPQDAPKMSTYYHDFHWKYAVEKFGRPASRWMWAVNQRMKHDDENAILWRWLFYQTVTAVEPLMLVSRWHRNQKSWKTTDKALWTARNDCSDRAAEARTYLQQLLDEINMWDGASPLPTPQVGPFRDCLNAMQDMHRNLSIEAAFYQTIAVDYHRQKDVCLQNAIQRLYGERLHARLHAIHLGIANDCIQFLDGLLNIDQRVLDRLDTAPQLSELLTTGRSSLRANFVAIRQLLDPILRSFGPESVNYAFRWEDFSGVATGSALDLAKRIERMAKRQLSRLSGPPQAIARGWLDLLDMGDCLRETNPGSAGDIANQGLGEVSDFIDTLTHLQEQQVLTQYPVQAQPQPVQQPVLETNQARPDPTMRSRRFDTSPPGQPPNPWQTVYAEASGYVPYRDPRTGFTRFSKLDIPNDSNERLDPDLAARALMQGQGLIGSQTGAAAASGIAAPNFPGVNMPNVGGELSNKQANSIAGLLGLINMRAATNPFAPAQPGGPAGALTPRAQPPALMTRQAQAVRDLGELVQARAAQIQANPQLAGRVVPSAFGQALQQIAGPSGANLTSTDVPGVSALFGESTLQRNWALQQLESVIRERALGPNLTTQLGGQRADPQEPQ